MKLSVSFRTDSDTASAPGGTVAAAQQEKQRGELLERLLMATCAEAWEAKGIPTTRLSSVQAAAELLKQWEALEAKGSKELREEYQKLGLPPEADAPKVLELLPRLKTAALWRALPVSELQKECRRLGITPSPGRPEDVTKRLVLASWGPPTSPGGGSQGGQPGQPRNGNGNGKSKKTAPAPQELLRDIANHFETLELSANATTDDLRKAYRKMVLQHHPDKNLDKSEEAGRKFRQVAAAYEALSDFMKEKN